MGFGAWILEFFNIMKPHKEYYSFLKLTSRSGLHVFFDPSDRFVERSSSGKDALDPNLMKRRDVAFGDDAADDDQDIVDFLLFHFLDQFFADRQVGS